MKISYLLVLVFMFSHQVFAQGRVLSETESAQVMPLTCNYIKKAFEHNSRYQVDLKKCVKSKVYIKVKDPNYGTYVYGDYKVDSTNKINCSIVLSDDLSEVKLADCSDE